MFDDVIFGRWRHIEPDSNAQVEEVTHDTCRQTTENSEKVSDPKEHSRSADDDENFLPSEWPPQVHDHIVGSFSDGFHNGEVLEVLDDETVKVWLCHPNASSLLILWSINEVSGSGHPSAFFMTQIDVASSISESSCFYNLLRQAKDIYLYVHQCRASWSNGKQCH